MNDPTEAKDIPLVFHDAPLIDQTNDRHVRSNKALLQLLRSGVIPMTSIENKHFREMVHQLDNSYAIPTLSIAPHYQQQPIQSSMKGFYLKDGRLSFREDLPLPVLKKEDALIRILRAGICATDQHMSQGYKGGFEGILGHEFVGIVERVESPMHNQWIGKRVVGEINLWCGNNTCHVCSQADKSEADQIRRRNHCPNRSCLGIINKSGTFAEFISLPVRNLFQVPSNISDTEAVFAEPLAAACRIMEQQLIQSTDRVAVLGDGKLGLLIASVIHAYGLKHQMTIIGKHEEKINLLPKEMTKILMNDSVAQTYQKEVFDVVVECTGSPSGIELASLLIKKKGIIVMKSTCSASTSNVNVGLLCEKQVTIHGSRCGPFEKAIELLTTKKIDVQKLVEATYPLEQVHQAFAHAAERGTLKIQLQMSRI